MRSVHCDVRKDFPKVKVSIHQGSSGRGWGLDNQLQHGFFTCLTSPRIAEAASCPRRPPSCERKKSSDQHPGRSTPRCHLGSRVWSS